MADDFWGQHIVAKRVYNRSLGSLALKRTRREVNSDSNSKSKEETFKNVSVNNNDSAEKSAPPIEEKFYELEQIVGTKSQTSQSESEDGQEIDNRWSALIQEQNQSIIIIIGISHALNEIHDNYFDQEQKLWILQQFLWVEINHAVSFDKILDAAYIF